MRVGRIPGLCFVKSNNIVYLGIDNYNILWYINIIQLFVHCPNGVSEYLSNRTRC